MLTIFVFIRFPYFSKFLLIYFFSFSITEDTDVPTHRIKLPHGGMVTMPVGVT